MNEFSLYLLLLVTQPQDYFYIEKININSCVRCSKEILIDSHINLGSQYGIAPRKKLLFWNLAHWYCLLFFNTSRPTTNRFNDRWLNCFWKQSSLASINIDMFQGIFLQFAFVVFRDVLKKRVKYYNHLICAIFIVI